LKDYFLRPLGVVLDATGNWVQHKQQMGCYA
jgi:hypothetical protein